MVRFVSPPHTLRVHRLEEAPTGREGDPRWDARNLGIPRAGTHTAAVESQLEEGGRAVDSHHGAESGDVQAKILHGGDGGGVRPGVMGLRKGRGDPGVTQAGGRLRVLGINPFCSLSEGTHPPAWAAPRPRGQAMGREHPPCCQETLGMWYPHPEMWGSSPKPLPHAGGSALCMSVPLVWRRVPSPGPTRCHPRSPRPRVTSVRGR